MLKLPDSTSTRELGSSEAVEPNGQEYLVTINGNVFVALSLAEAQAIVNSVRSRRRARFGDAARMHPECAATTEKRRTP